VTRARAYAKINLALVVGPLRDDGKHEVATVLQRVGLHDEITLEPAGELSVDGFPADTLVHTALAALARAVGVDPSWRVGITKRIPVAAGLGGGSSDAAASLQLANSLLDSPLPLDDLHSVAASVGSDVPFFLREGPQLVTGSGTDLTPLALPADYAVVLLVPEALSKESTAAVYREFEARGGSRGFEARRAALGAALTGIALARDLARLPSSDLVTSPNAALLADHGAFRTDVTGAGPAVYGLFETTDAAEDAAAALAHLGRTYVTAPPAGA
jgi:4-diphosphocytidyl-2-C-methyl-D-erythritol kinase